MRHALVTGASSGIGEAIAQRLLDEGWRVTGLSRRAPAWQHAHYAHRSVDLLEADALAPALAGLEPSALVHAAGLMRAAPLGDLQQATGTLLWRLHTDVAAQLADALVPRMGPGGRVVLIGSRAAGGSAGRSQYAASKAALLGLARSWAAELAPRGITVNVIAPGVTDTPMLRDPARAAHVPRTPPIGRLIAPQEVAALAAFLLGAEAAAITGQQIMICGGASL
ncbi:SDR family NAD(P)-dependent oxidoreductase [Falsiroseomonas selenitidurans]|uniref:SDR family oxidoreductase n=1 Tax=Falsiroseomonas selenitidurans TaxID=2716335 RepID=A0ABX1DZF7_9PROT|nr:SDR family oxidoreductase [Falsiroseomonas selenitidurans]NKC29878.1 SDR family oxidoreductase [Falsiroseomonas selenitidurans]